MPWAMKGKCHYSNSRVKGGTPNGSRLKQRYHERVTNFPFQVDNVRCAFYWTRAVPSAQEGAQEALVEIYEVIFHKHAPSIAVLLRRGTRIQQALMWDVGCGMNKRSWGSLP